MRRIAFRRLLPIANLVLATGLILVGNAQRTAEMAECEAGTAWCLESYDLPALSEVAFGINAPAVAVSLPMIFLLWALVGETMWPVYLSGAIGIVVFWYLVGRSLDRIRGLLPARTKKPPRLATRLLAWAGLFICPILAVIFFKRIFGIQGWHGEHDVYNLLGTSIWFVVAAVVLALKLRRWRALARAAASSPGQPLRA